MSIRVKAPKDLDGEQLLQELEAEGYVRKDDVFSNLIQEGGDLIVDVLTGSGAELDEGSRAKVERIVKAHARKPLRQRDPGDADITRLEQLDKKQGKLTPDEVEEAVRLLLKGKRPRREA